MRPAPPETDTPNTGRKVKHVALVEPGAEIKLLRKRQAILVATGTAAGFVGTLLADLLIRALV